MSTLELLGVASMLFTACFTVRAVRSAPGVGQSPRSAIIEAWFNLVIGFSINFVANTFIFPLVGAQITPAQNFWMGWIYTSVSIVRQYAVRRFFNAMLHAAALRLSGDHK